MTTKNLIENTKLSFAKLKKLNFNLSKKNSKENSKIKKINFSFTNSKNIKLNSKQKIIFFDNLYNLLNS
jgi:hypothetical protein